MLPIEQYVKKKRHQQPILNSDIFIKSRPGNYANKFLSKSKNQKASTFYNKSFSKIEENDEENRVHNYK